MARKITAVHEDKKHKVGRPSSHGDFVKHACPNLDYRKAMGTHGWTDAKVPVNTYASDTCGYCGKHVEDATGWEDLTPAEFKILQGGYNGADQ